MVSITFNDEEDFLFVCEELKHVTNRHKTIRCCEEEMKLTVAIEPYDTKMCYHVSQCISNCVIATYEKRWMDQLLRSTYYYQDDDEIGEISAIACSIWNGNKDLPGASKYSNGKKYLLESAMSCIEQGGTISFDSFLRFRTGHYRSLLSSSIGEAIDEYKLEQEYQNFIQSLRLLLKSRTMLEKRVILVFDGCYRLYDLRGNSLSGRISAQLDNLPNGLSVEEIDPEILLPLMILAPEEIYLYTDDNEDGLAQTIRNVFEERLYIFSYSMSKIHFSGNH